MVPLFITKLPLIVRVVVTVRFPFIVMLFRVDDKLPLIVPAPENISAPLPLPALKVPLFVKLPPPLIFRLNVLAIESVAPTLIVTDAATASAVETEGLFGVPEGMITEVVETGTVPTSQLVPVFQSLLVTPIQVLEAAIVD